MNVQPPRPRRAVPLLLIPFLLLAPAACDDGGGDDDISIAALTAELAAAVGADPPAQQAEKTMLDLARQTCKVMAQSGGCGQGAGPAGPRSLVASASGPLALLASRPRWDLDVIAASSPPLAVPPLGLTCVWNVDNDGWAGSDDIFGAVPSDRTRFEGYVTEPGGPVVPLQRTDRYFDVAPIEQASGQVEVELESRDAQTDATVVSLLLSGTVEPADGDVVDLLMSGSSGSDDATVLDFVFSIDRTELRNTMEVQDLLFISELNADGSGRFFVQRQVSPRQILEFTFSLDGAGQSITAGDVYVGDEQVAMMSGGRGAPSFDLTSTRFDESDNLAFIYTQLQLLDIRVIDLFYFGYCIGANTPEVCNVMRDRLGLG